MDNNLLSIYLAEYQQLKQEQVHRIGVRDNLIYVMLTAFGAVISFSLSDVNHYSSLLILPWIALVLGWTYLLNDKKVSEIGQYIKSDLVKNIARDFPDKTSDFFYWESYRSQKNLRGLKKYFQLFIDLTVFCFSGIAGLVLYLMEVTAINNVTFIIICLGGIMMLLLSIWFIFFAEL